MGFERVQNAREFGFVPKTFRVKLAHVHTGSEVEHPHTRNGFHWADGSQPHGHHGFQQGESHASSGTAQKTAAIHWFA
jgi:hypothetical protein